MLSVMEVFKDDVSHLEIGSSVESLQTLLVSQRDLFHGQIDQFQKIVVTQCKLAGINPLSQEMAAGALSIKIGKRPRDLLNPKAVNHMQSIFSIKDAISKKESRELSASFGITVTQIREFFTSQRSRVRRLVRLSKERAQRSNSCEEAHDGFPTNSDSLSPINPAPLNSTDATGVQDASCSTQDNALSVLDELNKHFVDNIFILMRKEETFSGQEKLMKWILKIQNYSVLYWFLSSGGMMLLATWLNEAAAEEQTSVLLLILKVLCHLPLEKALPTQMSAILQCVNKLRFYRTSDISNRARVLSLKWSKLSAKNQATNKPNSIEPSIDPQKAMALPQSFGQIMDSQPWHSHNDVLEDDHICTEKVLGHFRKAESPLILKLLPASLDDSTKKPVLGVSSSQTRKHRKVQLVDHQPGRKTVSRSPQATRTGSLSQGRPMSADDIKKAKMRAFYLQSKNGKPSTSKENKESKSSDAVQKHQTTQASVVASLSKVPLSPKIEDKKCPLVPPKFSNRQETSLDSKLIMDLKLHLWEKCKRVQIPWKTPAELKINDAWRVGAGENSKEVDVQINRNRREKETIHQTFQEIPSNPNEPWDLEINYDDNLTPEIPIVQQPDGISNADGNNGAKTPDAPVQVGGATSSSIYNAGDAEPDLELLAELLKNPELVFALTSGQAGSLPSEETVKLLDMIKKNMNGKQENVEVSLPSPTPPSGPRMSGWRTEAVKNPFAAEFSQISTIAFAVHPTNVAPISLPQATHIVSSSVHHSLYTNSPTIQTPSSDIGLTMKNMLIANASSVNLSRPHSPLARQVDGANNLKWVPNSSVQQERFSNSYSQSFVMPSPTPPISVTQQLKHPNSVQSYHTPVNSYPLKAQKQGPESDLRFKQDRSSNYHSHLNQNNNNTMAGGSRQSGSSWERNDNAEGQGFESWSPKNSPTRDHRYNYRRNLPESRIHPERFYRSEWSRQRGSFGYGDSGRHGNRKWHDQRR